MAVIVVDRLEAVEIDDADRDANAPELGIAECARELGEEAAPVRQLGQRVQIGEAEVLVRQRLRRRLLRQQRFAAGDEVGEVAVVDEQHRDDRAPVTSRLLTAIASSAGSPVAKKNAT